MHTFQYLVEDTLLKGDNHVELLAARHASAGNTSLPKDCQEWTHVFSCHRCGASLSAMLRSSMGSSPLRTYLRVRERLSEPSMDDTNRPRTHSSGSFDFKSS